MRIEFSNKTLTIPDMQFFALVVLCNSLIGMIVAALYGYFAMTLLLIILSVGVVLYGDFEQVKYE